MDNVLHSIAHELWNVQVARVQLVQRDTFNLIETIFYTFIGCGILIIKVKNGLHQIEQVVQGEPIRLECCLNAYPEECVQ